MLIAVGTFPLKYILFLFLNTSFFDIIRLYILELFIGSKWWGRHLQGVVG